MLVLAIGSPLGPLPWSAGPTDAAVIPPPCQLNTSDSPHAPLSVGTSPFAIGAGRFNSDQIDDLAVANGTSGTVTILLGSANGAYTEAPGSPITVGGGANSVAVGDLNQDGNVDLAVGAFTARNLSILLGNGTGGFRHSDISPMPMPGGPVAVVMGIFNTDAYRDMAVANFGSDTLTLLMSNGGTVTYGIGSIPSSAIGVDPLSLVAADFNFDARHDLAVANSGSDTVSILMNNGSGQFAPAGPPILVGDNPFSVVSGDFNGDVRVDLAVASFGSSSVSILLGNGSGGFAQSGPARGIDGGSVALAVADLTRNGKDDLIVAALNNTLVHILLDFNGSGFSTTGVLVPENSGARAVAVGNFNSTNGVDIAVAANVTNKVHLFHTTCPLADVRVTLSDAPDPATADSDYTYTVTASNAGPDSARFVNVKHTMPPNTALIGFNWSNEWTCTTPGFFNNGTIDCTRTSLAAGAASSLSIVVRSSTIGTITSTASAESSIPDSNPSNNTASATTTVAPRNCQTSRPRVAVMAAPAGSGRLQVTIASATSASAPNNRLLQLRVTIPANAQVDVQGGASGLTGQQTLTVGPATTSMVLFVRRTSPGAITAPLVVTDLCGDWNSFVGGGSAAF